MPDPNRKPHSVTKTTKEKTVTISLTEHEWHEAISEYLTRYFAQFRGLELDLHWDEEKNTIECKGYRITEEKE